MHVCMIGLKGGDAPLARLVLPDLGPAAQCPEPVNPGAGEVIGVAERILVEAIAPDRLGACLGAQAVEGSDVIGVPAVGVDVDVAARGLTLQPVVAVTTAWQDRVDLGVRKLARRRAPVLRVSRHGTRTESKRAERDEMRDL